MFKKLKQNSIRKTTDKNLINRDLSQINAPLKTLGFLVDETVFQDFEALYDFSNLLGIRHKDVKIFSFLGFKKKAPSLRQDQISDKDFTWDGAIKNLSAQEFLSKSFDVLIGYYNGKNAFLDLMVSESKAKFKIGGIGADERLFDLLIAVDIDKTEAFKNETKKYLTILNKLK
ncbi:MAG: hypothetical protein ACI9M9_001670 [Flavobacteriaceae bacterium]|jgi:hypothetical protein